MSKIARGFFLLTISSFSAIAIGYAIHIALGRILGPAEYGVFNTVNALIAMVAVITTSGIPLTISKYVSEKQVGAARAESIGILKRGAILQSLIILPILLFYLLGADWLAQSVGDVNLASLIRIAALGIPISAMFGVFDNFLNGMKKFGRQAIDSIALNIGKLSAIALATMGFGVGGALWGYIIGGFIGFVIAMVFCLRLVRNEEKEHESKKTIVSIGYRKIINFAVPMVIYSVFFTALYNIDILSVKILLKSDVLTGFYSAAAMMAHVPMFLFMGLGAVLLPSLSGAISIGEIETTRKYLKNAIRYLMIILLPMALIVALTANDFASLIYSEKYAPAGSALGILFFGFVLVVFLQVFATTIQAEGNPQLIAGIMGLVVIASLALNWLFIPAFGISGAAMATTAASCLGMLIAGYYVSKKHQIVIDVKSIVRIAAGLVCILVLWFLLSKIAVFNGIMLLVEYGFLYCIFMLFLIFIGEIQKEDCQVLYKFLPQRISAPLVRFLNFS